TYGTKGQIILKFNPDLYDILKKLELVVIEIHNKPVPFFISHIEFRNNRSAIIKFHDFDSETIFQEFVGHKVYFHDKKDGLQKDALYENLKGFSVVDINYGKLGKIVDFIHYSKNIILKVIHEEGEILIPVSENIIINIDVENKVIETNCPLGLIEINK
ncbi:MAG: hypothetical protein JXB17_02740, partial [Bacteroidales bacterium]|nr:hypothetical protein [Bacteroidales bacterium]